MPPHTGHPPPTSSPARPRRASGTAAGGGAARESKHPYPESFPIFTKLNTSIHAAGYSSARRARSLQRQRLHGGRRWRPAAAAAATALAKAGAGGGRGCYPPPAGSWACSISQERRSSARSPPLLLPLPVLRLPYPPPRGNSSERGGRWGGCPQAPGRRPAGG